MIRSEEGIKIQNIFSRHRIISACFWTCLFLGGPRHDKCQNRGGRGARGDHAEGGQSLWSQLQLPQRNFQPLPGQWASGSCGMKCIQSLFACVPCWEENQRGKILILLLSGWSPHETHQCNHTELTRPSLLYLYSVYILFLCHESK